MPARAQARGAVRVETERHVADPLAASGRRRRAVGAAAGRRAGPSTRKSIVAVVAPSSGLRGRREDGGGEPVSLAQPGREPDAGDRAGRCVLLPAAPGEVPPDDALDRQDLHAPAEQHPAAQLVGATGPRRWECRRIRRDEMVGHDPGRLGEPEPRQPGEHPALVRDRRRQDDVEGGEPIRGDEQEPVRVHRVQVTDLAGADERPRRRHRTIPGSMASRRAMTVGTWVRNPASSKQASRRARVRHSATLASVARRSWSGRRSSAARSALR